MFILRQSTAKDIKLGPFVDKTDGVTYETGMAAAMDHADTGVRLSKNGAAFADRNEGTEPAYDAFGYYLVKLDTTDTNTVGTLKVIFGAAATCLPCEANFQVVEEAIFDSLYAASAVGFDANQRVNVGQWLSQAVTLSSGNKPDVNIDEVSDDATAAATLELFVEAVDQATGQIDSGSFADGAIAAAALGADCITNAKIADNAIGAENLAADCITNAKIADNAIGAENLAADCITNAKIADNAIGAENLAADAITAAKVAADVHAEAADAVWNEAQADHVAVGTFGLIASEIADILTDTGELQTDWVNGGRLDLILDIIAADTTTDIPALISTAQADLDLLTGADGATLATLQGNYAPSKHTAQNVWDVVSALAGLDFGTLLERLYQLKNNRQEGTDADGSISIKNIGNTAAVGARSVTDDDTTTVLTEVTWS